MTTSNPALNESYFQSESMTGVSSPSNVMTVQGAVIKSLVLAGIMFCVAAVTWGICFPNGVSDKANAVAKLNVTAMWGFIFGGAIGGLVLGLIMCFSPKSSPMLAPLYAACEGAFLGAISGVYAIGAYPAIVIQAAMLTIGILIVMLTAYMTGMIKMTDKLRAGIVMATGAVMLVYLATMLLNMFGIRMPYIHDAGPIGIGISAVIIVIASLNLLLDFDTIERGARYEAPKYMEWYSAYGLLVTVVWLYLEILRLLAKLNRSE